MQGILAAAHRPLARSAPRLPAFCSFFDRFPKAKLILGHNCENIPFSAWRLQHWMEFNPGNDRPKKRIQDYLRDNVYTTISGDWSVPALLCTMQVMGTDRMLFSLDYPFENMDEASEFLDNAPISESDRAKLAHENARKLFHLPALVESELLKAA